MGIIPSVAGLGVDASGMHLRLPIAAALGHHPGLEYAATMGGLSGLTGSLTSLPMATVSNHMTEISGLPHQVGVVSYYPPGTALGTCHSVLHDLP